MKLFGYEERAVRSLPGLLNLHRTVVAVGPTGCGKTVIGAELIRQMPGARVLWIAHRSELLRQAHQQLLDAGLAMSDLGILSGPMKRNTGARVLVASVAMLREWTGASPDIVVIDEAHHVAAESYQTVIAAHPEAFVLGLTATPWRLDGKPLGDVFRHLYVIAEPIECVADGSIRPVAMYACVEQGSAKAMTRGLSTSGGDWSRKKLESVMRKPKLMADIVAEWRRLANGLQTIVFATTVAHAEDVRQRFIAAGVTCETVSWETPDQKRRDILERLTDGTTTVVVNVQVFTEGLDCPPVKCIVMARPTKSLTLYRQMLGRASRPHGTRRAVALDHAGNVWRHGLPDREVEWSLVGTEKTSGAPMVKKCAGCERMLPIATKECPHCGAQQPIDQQELEQRNAELARVRETEQMLARREKVLERIAKYRGAPAGWTATVMAKYAGTVSGQ